MKEEIIKILTANEVDVRLFDRSVETRAVKKMDYNKVANEILKLVKEKS